MIPRAWAIATALAAVAAREASAQHRADSLAADSVRRLEGITVTVSRSGQGLARAANAVTARELRAAPAGTSALRVIEQLPGVNVQSADPLALYEWSNRVTMRGFQTQQVGHTIDGIPLGDMTYAAYNGLGVGRAADPDNLVGASVAQGSSALGTASTSNLGGVIEYTTAEPTNRAGVTLRQLVGESRTRKSHLRLESGLRALGSVSAVKAFASLSRVDADKWKGSGQRYSPEQPDLFGHRGLWGRAGEQWQDQVNVKLMAIAGAHTLTAFYNFADRKESDYVDLSLQRYRESGREWDQYGEWARARSGAESATPDEAYFHSAIGARRDHLAYLSGTVRFNDRLRLVITPYRHGNRGVGDWHAPNYGDASFSPDPIFFRQTRYSIDRDGVIAGATLRWGAHHLSGGLWREQYTSRMQRVAWRLADYRSGGDVNFADVLRLFFDRTGQVGTTLLHVQDRVRLHHDRIALTFGVKRLAVDADFRSNGLTVPAARTAPDVSRPAASFPIEGTLLPQAGIVVTLVDSAQLFANFAENVNAFPYSPQLGLYNMDPRSFDSFNRSTRPERATTVEIGARTRRAGLEASVAAYAIDYRHRLVEVASCPLTATCGSTFANVGGVTTRGAEVLAVWTPTTVVSWLTSASYNRSTIDDDYLANAADASSRVPSRGKAVVDAPRALATSRIRAESRGWTAELGARYVGRRYFSIVNDMSVDGYGLADASLGYRCSCIPGTREATLRVNVWNLLDRSYIATVGSPWFTVRGDVQNLQAGPPRMMFLTMDVRF